MFEFSEQQIGAMIGSHLWPLFRISSFMMTAPILGTQIVPARIRLLLALMMTVVVVPALPSVPQIDPLSLSAVTLIFHQVFIGLAMGFAVLMLFQLFVVAGQMLAMQMGLGFAAMVDPTNGISVTALSQFYLMLVTLLFLAMNGHLVMFEALIESFTILPISQGGMEGQSWWYLASRISWMFAGALVVALPAVTSVFIVNISFGVMTRAAPQMNIFSIGFPLTVLFGLLVFWISVGSLIPQFTAFSENTFEFMRAILLVSPQP